MCGRDISAGVGLYTEDLFESADQTILGSGEARIVDLQLLSGTCSAGLGETLEIDYGDSIQFEPGSNEPGQLRDVRIEYLFWNVEMLPILEVMTESLKGYRFDFPESGEVSITG